MHTFSSNRISVTTETTSTTQTVSLPAAHLEVPPPLESPSLAEGPYSKDDSFPAALSAASPELGLTVADLDDSLDTPVFHDEHVNAMSAILSTSTVLHRVNTSEVESSLARIMLRTVGEDEQHESTRSEDALCEVFLHVFQSAVAKLPQTPVRQALKLTYGLDALVPSGTYRKRADVAAILTCTSAYVSQLHTRGIEVLRTDPAVTAAASPIAKMLEERLRSSG